MLLYINRFIFVVSFTCVSLLCIQAGDVASCYLCIYKYNAYRIPIALGNVYHLRTHNLLRYTVKTRIFVPFVLSSLFIDDYLLSARGAISLLSRNVRHGKQQ